MNNGQQIEWQDLDKRRYYIIGPSLFLCIRGLLYPVNLVKTRLFMQQRHSVYSGTFDAFRKVLKYEGIRGLYKGFTVSIFGLAAGQLYITTYEVVRSRLQGYSSEMKGLIAGGCATVAGQIVTVPVDIVSQHRMMDGQVALDKPKVRHSQYILVKSADYVLPKKPFVRSAYIIIKDILRTEGVRGLHRGYTVSFLTYAPNSALWWSSYSFLFRKSMEWGLGEALPTPAVQGCCGVVGGTMAASLTNPLDVVRTRYQVCAGVWPCSVVIAARITSLLDNIYCPLSLSLSLYPLSPPSSLSLSAA